MSRVCQTIFCLAAVAVAVVAQGQPAAPAPIPVKFSHSTTNLMPLPTVQSPVNFFRQLLMMPPVERNQMLAGRTPESRIRIMAKIHEYQALGPDERELRLRATELRWYLMPLMLTPATNRDPQLARVPVELRQLAQSRLTQWDLLPPMLKQAFLTNDQALHYFAQPPDWDATNSQSQKIAEQFNQFFELTPGEKKQVLSSLSQTERTQMEKTLHTFDQLPPSQRALCVRNYAKFAGMSGSERAEFLKNAESWSKMSPQERQTWRDLVEHAPLWPPVPEILPPMPPVPLKISRAGMATN